jgi:predicted phosphodiesterase
VVNYGPWSNECVELIENLENSFKVMGNHEEYYLKKRCDTKNHLTQKFFNFCINDFQKFDLIKKYKKEIFFEKIKFTHSLDNKYIYEDTVVKINENTVIGHSHNQFKKKVNNFWIINPGSLGQNRKEINRMEYAILNTKSLDVEFMSKTYNVNKLLNKMHSACYPKECIDYYLKKIK